MLNITPDDDSINKPIRYNEFRQGVIEGVIAAEVYFSCPNKTCSDRKLEEALEDQAGRIHLFCKDRGTVVTEAAKQRAMVQLQVFPTEPTAGSALPTTITMFTQVISKLFQAHGAVTPPLFDKQRLIDDIERLIPININYNLSPGGSAVTSAIVKRSAPQ